jgi:hypothetical protein
MVDTAPSPDQAGRRMKRLVSLSLCLSLSLFAVARAMKQSPTLAVVVKTAPTKNESANMSEGDEPEVAGENDTDEQGTSANDDDSMKDASDDEGEDMSHDDAADDDNAGDDDSAGHNESDDDTSGDNDGGDDGGD